MYKNGEISGDNNYGFYENVESYVKGDILEYTSDAGLTLPGGTPFGDDGLPREKPERIPSNNGDINPPEKLEDNKK